mgnify:CR=1 FL=1
MIQFLTLEILEISRIFVARFQRRISQFHDRTWEKFKRNLREKKTQNELTFSQRWIGITDNHYRTRLKVFDYRYDDALTIAALG